MTKQRSLTRIERHVLEHVARYRLTTRRGWRGAWELRMFDDIAITRTVQRLIRCKFLRVQKLFGDIHSFELTPKAIEQLGLSHKRNRRTGRRSLIRSYGQLLFATTGPKPWVLHDNTWDVGKYLVSFAPAETPEVDLPTRNFLFDPVTQEEWTQVWVDQSISDHSIRMAQRLNRSACSLVRNPHWARLIESKSFSMSVVTKTEHRAELILARFRKYRASHYVTLKLMVAPALEALTQSLRLQD